jgi:hypothetical protein
MTACGSESTGLGKLERRALDELALRARCSMADPLACCDHCWHRWVRARFMEHLRGEHYWDELDRGDFGLLRRRWHPDGELVARIVALVAAGAENLSIIAWALGGDQPLDDVVFILRILDVNVRRLPRFPWLSRTVRCIQPAAAVTQASA